MGRLCVCVGVCACMHVCVHASMLYLHSCVCVLARMHAETLMFNSELGKHIVYVAVYHKDASALPFKTSCLSISE